MEPSDFEAIFMALEAAKTTALELADPEVRKSWIADKGVVVLALWSPRHPTTEIDIFVEEPFVFDDAFARAVRAVLGTTVVVVASIEDLIALERRVGRPKDPWQRHELEQRRRWRKLTPAQRLAWLWQAKVFARRALGRARPVRVKP